MRPRLLIVDDDEILLRITARFATLLGFEPVATASPREALAHALDGTAFAALVTDHEMPGITGLDLIARIAAAGIVLPALLVSGRDIRVAPSQRFLPKPFRVHDLARELDALGVTVPVLLRPPP